VTRRVETAPTFERDLKRLGRRYRRIRSDLEPLIEQLVAGETPGDRLQGVPAVAYKVRLTNRDARRGKSGGYRVIYCLPANERIFRSPRSCVSSRTSWVPSDHGVRVNRPG